MKIIIIITLSTFLLSCNAQKTKSEKAIFTQYCEKAMLHKNILILNFSQVDSLLGTSPDFGDFFLEKANWGTKSKYDNIIRKTSIHKKTDLPTKKRTETLFVYKDQKVMEIHLTFHQSGTYNHSSYIHSIPFVEGKYEMDYIFPSKYENLKYNSFYKDMPKDYFENQQEEIDFSNLKFNYIDFSKDKEEFTWKKE